MVKMQKLFSGDLVHIDVSENRKHFVSGADAIVLHGYSEKYGVNCSDIDNIYCVFLLDGSEKTISWYLENELLFREPNRFDLLPENHIVRSNYFAKLDRDRIWLQNNMSS